MSPEDRERLFERSLTREFQPEFWAHAKTCPLPTDECQICKPGFNMRFWLGREIGAHMKAAAAGVATEPWCRTKADEEAQLELEELGLCVRTPSEQQWLVASVIAKHVRDHQLRAELEAAIRERDEARVQLRQAEAKK